MKPRNIVLFKDAIIVSHLDYDKAIALLQKANRTKAAESLSFSITREPGEHGWKLVSRPITITHAFLNEPEDFVIQDED